MRVGSIPEVITALRDNAIGLLRVIGETNIAAAYRRLTAQPTAVLAMIGVGTDSERTLRKAAPG